jgi:hypothetical protein
MAQAQKQTYNHDVVGVWNRINRFAEEAQKAQSSNVSLTNSFDIARLKSYLDSIDRYHDWIKAQPQLDLPETTPRLYQLEDWVDASLMIENDDLDDIVRMFFLARDEIVNSQSSRLGSGLLKPDSDRLTAVVAKARAFIMDYVEPTTPLDLPESSPLAPMSGSGRMGV